MQHPADDDQRAVAAAAAAPHLSGGAHWLNGPPSSARRLPLATSTTSTTPSLCSTSAAVPPGERKVSWAPGAVDSTVEAPVQGCVCAPGGVETRSACAAGQWCGQFDGPVPYTLYKGLLLLYVPAAWGECAVCPALVWCSVPCAVVVQLALQLLF